MNAKTKKDFRIFLNNNRRNRIENDGVAVWNHVLEDLPWFDGKQPRVSFAFSRYQHNHVDKTILSDILKDGREQVVGLVVAIPSYWLNADEYLVTCYVEYYIDEFVNEYFKERPQRPCRPPRPDCPIAPPVQPPKPPCPKPEPLPPGFSPAGTPTPPPMYFPPQGQPPMSPPRPSGSNIPQDFNKM